MTSLVFIPPVGTSTASFFSAMFDEFRLHAHHWLILHGRYTCKARSPDCAHCPVFDLCAFKEKNV